MEEKKKRGIAKGIPKNIWELWEARCARFRNVEWVQKWKPGVKVLTDK